METPVDYSVLMLNPPATVACKVCGGVAAIVGAVDFNRSCEVGLGKAELAPCGISIPYHRCGQCGLIFTMAFDKMCPQDFLRLIYNDGYAAADPDYAQRRPLANSITLRNMFQATPDLRILDYGGGNGQLAALLREAGFARVDTFDPFVAQHAARPPGRYDLVVCFEVMEHSPQPRGTLADIASFIDDPGMLIFSTLLQPADIAAMRLHWWYVAPRNGHCTLHSRASLARLTRDAGFALASTGDALHLMFKTIPPFAAHMLRRRPG
jgi:2-polyprenyl-6-hydroxyphenyl methylase/3-demethylubiquinone-9 3-methyltransferase